MGNNGNAYVLWFEELRRADVSIVGGKSSSLGELTSATKVPVPYGYATTADAYRYFMEKTGQNKKIHELLGTLSDVEDSQELQDVCLKIRQSIISAEMPSDLANTIGDAYDELAKRVGVSDPYVAVRSSATAEDLPDASFAGQQETFLNINGLENVKEAMHHVFASLYNDRAISYRVHKGFEHDIVALSAGVQRMVRSDSGASGVMFTIDTESGYDQVVFVTSSYGLGENVVQGAVNPDEFYVFKPTLKAGKPAILRKTMGSKQIKMIFTDKAEAGKSVTNVDVPEEDRQRFSITDAEVTELAHYALTIEKHYGRPMDIEWGRDGLDGKLYILQARPETVKSQEDSSRNLRRFSINGEKVVLCEGRAIGQKVGQGKVRLVKDASEMDSVEAGDVLVTDMTDPDWEPVMKRASAIVTNRGGRTCHAAIIARELGIPAVVGCGDATDLLSEGQEVTVSCAEGDTGFIYSGLLDVQITDVALDNMPKAPVKVMMNVGNPELAFSFANLPSEGIGLARMEFIINRQIGIHPKALLEFDKQDDELKAEITRRIAGYASPVDFYVDKIAEGVATLAASVYPRKTIVRMSDFKSNEYANLVGGSIYEPHEENPMLGFRGAARYVADNFKDCFALECKALKRVRDEMGLTNVEIMIPFVRTLGEAEAVVKALKENGLERGKNGLRLIMMCELPSNAVLAEQFLQYFDGFSIGSNDMTQLTLGLDRDSGLVSDSFDERNPAVKVMLHLAISACRKQNKYVGICGQGPSDHPDFAKWLVEEGIESVSLNPDTVIETWLYLANELNK